MGGTTRLLDIKGAGPGGVGDESSTKLAQSLLLPSKRADARLSSSAAALKISASSWGYSNPMTVLT
jgi:hypothetical protein